MPLPEKFSLKCLNCNDATTDTKCDDGKKIYTTILNDTSKFWQPKGMPQLFWERGQKK